MNTKEWKRRIQSAEALRIILQHIDDLQAEDERKVIQRIVLKGHRPRYPGQP